MSNLTKIFVGVVPDDLRDHDFDMIVADTVNETQHVYDLSIGENARVISITESTVIAFVRKPKVERPKPEAQIIQLKDAKKYAVDENNA
jgi:reverse gyrase